MAQKNHRNTKNDTKFILSDNSPFLVREDYKALRTNIDFSFPKGGSKVLAVTSSASSEGKSTNSINLAISYAQIGKKVLLIDGDMRLPTVMAKLEMGGGNNQKGLSDLLIGAATLEEVFLFDHKNGIFVLSSGTIPPDPTRLLESDRMKTIIQAFRQKFDYIIIDCPPVTEVIDAAILSPFVDGYLLVVRHASSTHRNVNEMLFQLQRANANIIGFIYANAPNESRKYYKKGGNYYSNAESSTSNPS